MERSNVNINRSKVESKALKTDRASLGPSKTRTTVTTQRHTHSTLI